MKKNIITITGFPGSGKSSTAKEVARVLGYKHFSSGDWYRAKAAERGISVEEMNFTAEKEKEIDTEIDQMLVKVGKEENDLVIDSRTAFHWIPASFKIFLDLDLRTAAERTFANIRKEGRNSQKGSSVDEIYNNTLARRESERKRYWDLYKIDYSDKRQFDLIIDTATHDLDQVTQIVLREYKKWLDVRA